MLLGAGGQLGTLVHNLAPESVNLHAFSHTDLDITRRDDLASAISRLKPEIIINTAAYTAVDKAETEAEQAYAVNACAPGLLAELAPKTTRLIHLSTDFVFSGAEKSPWQPAAKTGPLCVYGKSKRQGEQALLSAHPDNCVILRTSWLYSSRGRNFVTTMLALMASKPELRVVNDQFGSPTSAAGLADVIWLFVQHADAEGIFHWSDAGVITWYDFALEIQRQAVDLGLLAEAITVHPVPTTGYPTPAERPRYSALDSTATETLLGLKPQDWREQLAKVLGEIKAVAGK